MKKIRKKIGQVLNMIRKFFRYKYLLIGILSKHKYMKETKLTKKDKGILGISKL